MRKIYYSGSTLLRRFRVDIVVVVVVALVVSLLDSENYGTLVLLYWWRVAIVAVSLALAESE